MRIFLDQRELDHGVAWQQKIYDALAGCRHVAACLSPAYLASKMCQEEYLLARMRHREEGGVLLPVLPLQAARGTCVYGEPVVRASRRFTGPMRA